jgi:hypothetical protein
MNPSLVGMDETIRDWGILEPVAAVATHQALIICRSAGVGSADAIKQLEELMRLKH